METLVGCEACSPQVSNWNLSKNIVNRELLNM